MSSSDGSWDDAELVVGDKIAHCHIIAVGMVRPG